MITDDMTIISSHRNSESNNVEAWQWFFFILLQIFNLYQIYNHVMWRDELQAWSLVCESRSIQELLHNLRYEGFPSLWYVLLWPLSLVSVSPLVMQLFHFTCSLLAQSIVMLRAPFSGNIRLAIVAGYYISFEYCIISRAYVLGVLIVFVYCAFHSWMRDHPVVKGATLGLLANTSVYGAMMSLLFVADHFFEAFIQKDRILNEKRSNIVRFALFAVPYVFLFSAALKVALPPPDGDYAAGLIQTTLYRKFFLICKNLVSMIPVPSPRIDFWNTLVVLDNGIWLTIAVSLVMVAAIWVALRGTPRYLMLFIAGFNGIWLFSVIKFVGYLRHAGGALMLLFIACLWLATKYNQERKIVSSRFSDYATWIIFGLNLIAFSMASFYHLQRQFSGSLEMAQYIRHNINNSQSIVSDSDFTTSSVAGYLGRPFYFTANGRLQTYIRWNRDRIGGGLPDALHIASTLVSKGAGTIYLLLNYPTETSETKLLYRTGTAILTDEVFYLYQYVP